MERVFFALAWYWKVHCKLIQLKGMKLIKTHKELADYIAGRKILHLNSLGKDSIVCLEWLTSFAHPSEIVSMYCEFIVRHPKDGAYKKYLKKKYPSVNFVESANPFEVSAICMGVYQSPVEIIKHFNHLDFNSFDMKKLIEDARVEYGCDFICIGKSRYESFDRANFFHKNGLLKDKHIYPIGMMSKKQVMSLINFKLHPVYKYSKSTLDTVSYYKMRAAFLAHPEYYEEMIKFYPLLKLDKYRWERLMK